MLDEIKSVKFEENLQKEADLTPVYQITKLASDTYQIYSFENKSAEIINSKAALKTVASLRGGSYLSADLTKSVTELDNFSSVIITADALKMTKTAAVSTDKEPWALKSINGVEYFVKADGEEEEDDKLHKEESLSCTAAAKPVEYTVRINAHNVAEIGKIASIAEEEFGAQYGSVSIPSTESIVFIVASPEDGAAVHKGIQTKLDQNKIFLPNEAVMVAKPDGAICNHMENEHGMPEYCRDTKDMCKMTSPETKVVYFADKPETLKGFADGHFADYKIEGSEATGGHLVDGPGYPASGTFGEVLASFLYDSNKRGFEKAAAGMWVSKKNDETGALYDANDPSIASEDPNNLQVVKKQEAADGASLGAVAEPGATPEAPVQANPGDQPVKMDTQQQGDATKAIDPNEKPSDETKQKGDNEVKRWKGMREDPSTGKYVVYITETEEHIYDNAEDAINFLVRK